MLIETQQECVNKCLKWHSFATTQFIIVMWGISMSNMIINEEKCGRAGLDFYQCGKKCLYMKVVEK